MKLFVSKLWWGRHKPDVSSSKGEISKKKGIAGLKLINKTQQQRNILLKLSTVFDSISLSFHMEESQCIVLSQDERSEAEPHV